MTKFIFLFALVLVSVSSGGAAVELQTAECTSCLVADKPGLYCLYTYGNNETTTGAFAVCHPDNSTRCEHIGTLEGAVEGKDTGIVEVHDYYHCDDEGEYGVPSPTELEENAYIVPMDTADKTERELGEIVDCQACIDTIVDGSQGWCIYEGGGYCGYPTTDGDGVCKALGGIPKDGELMTECPVEPTSASTVAEIGPSNDVTPSSASSYCASASFIVVLAHLLCIL